MWFKCLLLANFTETSGHVNLLLVPSQGLGGNCYMQGPWNYIGFVVIPVLSIIRLCKPFCFASPPISHLLRFGRVGFKFSALIHTGHVDFRKPQDLAKIWPPFPNDGKVPFAKRRQVFSLLWEYLGKGRAKSGWTTISIIWELLLTFEMIWLGITPSLPRGMWVSCSDDNIYWTPSISQTLIGAVRR